YRNEFEVLVSAGARVAEAHAAQLSGRSADLREVTSARREALSVLSRLAESLLRDAGHNPTADTMRRITTNLEAVSTNAVSERPGLLTADAAAPGFDALAGLIPSTGISRPPQGSRVLAFKPAADKSKLDAAKAALDAAESTVREKRTALQQAVTALQS